MRSSRQRVQWFRRIGTVLGITAGLVLVGTASAWAHVTVDAPGATPGGSDQIITFRVPTESDTASTTALKVQLPTDTPIASVLVQPVAGWSFTETSVKLAKPIVTDDGDITEAVSEIDWKADSAASYLAPEQFGEFTIIAGQLPDVPSLTFKAIQSYSDNTTVSWTEVEAPGSTADLDHPAPVLTLAKATDSSGGGSSDTGPIILSIVALVVAAAALGYAFVTRAKQRGSAE
jgi:periplasmic copper chaperone A